MGRPKDRRKRRQCFREYVKLGTHAAVARATGVDAAQISRWAKEENWDEQVASLQGTVGDRLGLEKLEEEQVLDLATVKWAQELTMFRELALAGLEAFEDGDVEFKTMGEVRGALKDYVEFKRLLEGEPNSRHETEVRVSAGRLFGQDVTVGIAAMLQLAAADKDEGDDEVTELDAALAP